LAASPSTLPSTCEYCWGVKATDAWPEALADDLGVHAGGERDRRVGVPEVVQPDHGQTQPPDLPLKPLLDNIRVRRPPVLPRADFRRRAHTIATELAAHNAPAECADLLEQLITTGPPVQRSS